MPKQFGFGQQQAPVSVSVPAAPSLPVPGRGGLFDLALGQMLRQRSLRDQREYDMARLQEQRRYSEGQRQEERDYALELRQEERDYRRELLGESRSYDLARQMEERAYREQLAAQELAAQQAKEAARLGAMNDLADLWASKDGRKQLYYEPVEMSRWEASGWENRSDEDVRALLGKTRPYLLQDDQAWREEMARLKQKQTYQIANWHGLMEVHRELAQRYGPDAAAEALKVGTPEGLEIYEHRGEAVREIGTKLREEVYAHDLGKIAPAGNVQGTPEDFAFNPTEARAAMLLDVGTDPTGPTSARITEDWFTGSGLKPPKGVSFGLGLDVALAQGPDGLPRIEVSGRQGEKLSETQAKELDRYFNDLDSELGIQRMALTITKLKYGDVDVTDANVQGHAQLVADALRKAVAARKEQGAAEGAPARQEPRDRAGAGRRSSLDRVIEGSALQRERERRRGTASENPPAAPGGPPTSSPPARRLPPGPTAGRTPPPAARAPSALPFPFALHPDASAAGLEQADFLRRPSPRDLFRLPGRP